MDTHRQHGEHGDGAAVSLNRLAARATTHCLTGCAIGEVLGLVIGTALGWAALPTIVLAVVLAVVLAFIFGYGFTLFPLVRSGLSLRTAVGLALAADTISIAVMELVDNGIMLVVPGAMDAHLDSPLFWGSLAVALAIAWVVAFPVNRWHIARGRGHVVVHGAH